MFRTAKIFTTTIPEVSRLPQVFCFAEKEAARRPATRERTGGQTGVEMEALTACSVACLTLYDMCKAVDRGMTITDCKLLEKHGGKSNQLSGKMQALQPVLQLTLPKP